MKRSKRLYGMLGILVVVCIATIAVMRTEEKKEQIKSSGEIIPELSADDVQSLDWEYEDTSLSFHKDGIWLCDDDEAFPVSEDKIRELLESFEAFGVSFVIEEVTDYSMYGLDDPICTIHLDTPELTITVDYTTQDEDDNEVTGTFVVSVSRDPEKLAAAEEAEEKGEEAEEVPGYVRVGDSQIVYEISEYDCENLLAASYNDLRHREVLTAAFEDVYQVDISLDGSDYTIAADGDDDGERIWKYLEEEIAVADFQGALEDLCADSTEDFTSEKPAGKKEISLTVFLNNENDPEVKIDLYRYDGSTCLAAVDGQPFALVARSDVVDLIETVNAIVLN